MLAPKLYEALSAVKKKVEQEPESYSRDEIVKVVIDVHVEEAIAVYVAGFMRISTFVLERDLQMFSLI